MPAASMVSPGSTVKLRPLGWMEIWKLIVSVSSVRLISRSP
jgi:hypothetical protein